MTTDGQKNNASQNNISNNGDVEKFELNKTLNSYSQTPSFIAINYAMQSNLIMGKVDQVEPQFFEWVEGKSEFTPLSFSSRDIHGWTRKIRGREEKDLARREGLFERNNRPQRYIIQYSHSEMAYLHIGSFLVIIGGIALLITSGKVHAATAVTTANVAADTIDLSNPAFGETNQHITVSSGYADNASHLSVIPMERTIPPVSSGYGVALVQHSVNSITDTVVIVPEQYNGAGSGFNEVGAPTKPYILVATLTVNGVNTATAVEDDAVIQINGLANVDNVNPLLPLNMTNLPTSYPGNGWSYDPVTHIFSFDPSASDYQYLNEGETVQYTINYNVTNGFITLPDSVVLTLIGVNDAPVVTGPVHGAVIEDGTTVSLNALSNASDVDHGTVLNVVDVPTILPNGVTYDSLTQTFTLDPTDAAYQSLAQGEQIIVTVDYNVTDGIVKTPASASWTITGINDPPVISGAVQATVFEDAASSVLNALTNASDVDHGTILTVTDLPATLPDGVTFDSLTNNFTLDASNVAFQHLGPGQTEMVTVNYDVSDGITTTAASVQWTVKGVNDALQITTLDTQTYTENSAAISISPNATVTDVDSLNFNGGKLTVHFTSGSDLFDQLGVANQGTGTGQIGVSGLIIKTVSYEGHAIGTINLLQNGLLGDDLVINLTTNFATPEAAQALLRDITYKSNFDDSSSTPNTVSFILVDGDGTANGGTDTGTSTATINVEPVNDAPTNIKPGSQTVNEDTQLTINGLSVIDLDAGLADIKVTLSVVHGTLNVDSSILGGAIVGNGTDTVVLTGSQLAIDAILLQGVKYQGVLNFNGSDQLTMISDDLGNSGSGGAKTDTDIINITVKPVNDVPVVSGPISGTAIENGATVTLDALANTSDVDDAAVLSVVNVPASLPAGVIYNAAIHSFSLDPTDAAYQALA